MHSVRFSSGTIIAAAVACCVGTACGSVGTSGSAPGQGTSDETATSSAALDARGAALAAARVRRAKRRLPETGVPGTGFGFIEVAACTGGPGCKGAGSTTSVYATFGVENADPGDAAPPSCTYAERGPCELSVCTGAGGGDDTLARSAGALTFSGGSLDDVAVKSTAKAGWVYSWGEAGLAFTGGDLLTVTGAGASVPAFGAESIEAPGAIRMIKPEVVSGSYAVATAKPLRVVWKDAAGAATVDFALSASSTSGDTNAYLQCSWPSSQNEATIPDALLTPLAGMTNGYLQWDQSRLRYFGMGEYTVNLEALEYGQGPVTLE